MNFQLTFWVPPIYTTPPFPETNCLLPTRFSVIFLTLSFKTLTQWADFFTCNYYNHLYFLSLCTAAQRQPLSNPLEPHPVPMLGYISIISILQLHFHTLASLLFCHQLQRDFSTFIFITFPISSLSTLPSASGGYPKLIFIPTPVTSALLPTLSFIKIHPSSPNSLSSTPSFLFMLQISFFPPPIFLWISF